MSRLGKNMKTIVTGRNLAGAAILILIAALLFAGCTAQKETVKLNDTVKVHYTAGLASDGKVFESSLNGDPIQFVVGSGQVIPGFDRAVVGMSPGENKTVTITADQAYGPKRQEFINTLDKEQVRAILPESEQAAWNPKPGDAIRYMRKDGMTGYVFIVGVNETTVTLDENHPLAGQDLVFNIQLVEIVKK
jgi:peptidylprolyl isomerase